MFSSSQPATNGPSHRRSSRRDSVDSHAQSAYSHAGSTRPILTGMSQENNSSSDYGGLLNTPSGPLASGVSKGSANGLSLSVNYLPSKFSSSILSPGGARFRKVKGGAEPSLPKRGGGLEAFKSNESRMAQGKHQLRWNKFKWILFFTNTLLTTYSLAALVVCLLTWFDVWKHADVIRVGNRSELIISTIASGVGIFTALVGWAGILLNNRTFLAYYTFLTWVTFGFLVTPGYITYRRRTFNLEGKINAEWSRTLGVDGRLRIQNQLECCGYFSPFVEATISQTCYARSILAGCKGPYLTFERFILKRWYAAAFVLVPVHISVMLAGLLCSNHVTYRFGKGMMPERYRLNMATMATIMENYANQLADQYGADIADEVLKGASRSRAGTANTNTKPNLNTSLPNDSTGSVGYGAGGDQSHPPKSPFHAKYSSVGGRV